MDRQSWTCLREFGLLEQAGRRRADSEGVVGQSSCIHVSHLVPDGQHLGRYVVDV